MKKTISLLLLLLLCFSFAACKSSEHDEIKEISCENIIKSYEDADYYVTHGEHKAEAESSQLCYIKASLTEDSDSDYIYFITCFTEEQAEEIAKTDKYNLAVWLYATVSGESRWLKTGTYGKIEYSYYNPELIKPFNELINCEDSDSSEKSYAISYDGYGYSLIDGYAPTSAKAGKTVVIRTHPLTDVNLILYANGVKASKTHSDSDYWEYTFVMPEENVVITRDIVGGW